MLGTQIQHLAVIGFHGAAQELTDHPIDIGHLDTSVYKEVQHEAQTDDQVYSTIFDTGRNCRETFHHAGGSGARRAATDVP